MMRRSLTRCFSLVLSLLMAVSPCATFAQEPESRLALSDAKMHLIRRFEVKAAKVVDAVRIIAELSGLNIITTEDAAKKEVTLFLQDVTALGALEALCKSTNLWYREDEGTGTIRVMTTEEYQKDLIVFRDDNTRVFTLLHPNTTSVAMSIQALYGQRVRLSMQAMINDDVFMQTGASGSGVGGFGGGFGGTGSGVGGFGGSGFGGGVGGTSVGNQGFGGSSGGSAFGFGPNNSFGSTSGGGGSFTSFGGFGGGGFGSGVGGGFGNGFGINTTPIANELFNEQEALTSTQAQRISQQQALIDQLQQTGVGEATVRDITGTEPPIYVTINRQHNLVIVRTSDQKVMESITKLVSELDRPTPEVLLEMKIIELTLDDNFQSVFDFSFATGDPSTGPPDGQQANPFQPGPLAPENLGRVTPDLTNFPLAGGSLVYQFLNDHIRARIQLLDTDNRVNVVATPLLLASNNRSSTIFVGTQRVLTSGVTTLQTQGLNNTNTVITPTTEVVNVGTTLIITPRIDADRTVTLFLVQDSSSIAPGINQILVPNGNGGVTSQMVDGVNQRTMNGTVVAKDGLTVAVGGLITETHNNFQQKVPMLGDLPYLGFFFRREVRRDQKVELVLLITPHVITTPAEGELKSRFRLDELSHHPKVNNFSANGTLQFDYRRYPAPAPPVYPPDWQGMPAFEELPTPRRLPDATAEGQPIPPMPPDLPFVPN